MSSNKGNQSFSIKEWAQEDRPREKLLAKGKEALSNAELLAILIGSGSREESAVMLSQRILSSVHNSLNELGQKSVQELTKFKGIGEAKAISIVAAIELSRRRSSSESFQKPQITSSHDAYTILRPILSDLQTEAFWVLLLNRNNRVEAQKQISLGGVAGTVVDAKVVYKYALESLASSIVLAHNHPSGNLQPSQADISLTKKLVEAGKSLDIKVLDHIIVSHLGYYSFLDEGLI